MISSDWWNIKWCAKSGIEFVLKNVSNEKEEEDNYYS